MPTANPRAACVEALMRWEKGTEFADAVLHAAVDENRFSTLDRALFMEIFYGVIRFRRTLDFLVSKLREEDIDSRTRQALRIGLYQLLRMRVPQHAAVNETVEVAGRGRSLVNALLRRFLREEKNLRKHLDMAPLGVRLSHPEVLVDRWTRQFGALDTAALCEWNNHPAEILVRVNELKVTMGELMQAGGGHPAEAHPLMLKMERLPISWIVDGLCYVQDPSTLMACEMLAPRPGERVLDACAAPGGKTSYLAQMMRNEGSIVACDVSAERLVRMRENLARLSVTNVEVRKADWLKPPAGEREKYDRILLDAPCSNTGVIRRRIDVRWRLNGEDFAKMPEMQMGLLKNLSARLKPGGSLVYSTCSMEPEENEEIVRRMAREVPELKFQESRRTLPFRDKVDGAFAARFTVN
ncbi:MAG TPA: 16S rRNA (cytosine(967)-C(5))-methyltransferase RsmB [Chthoniobacteraceae bacterium]|jgi:16S rRNA (cytosine967-C5)-methyltransferase|nr:16S rRNA (cytosine(967)-C(5))-methyltransferase RsmB [Chthoniobacteraceae bacterium]